MNNLEYIPVNLLDFFDSACVLLEGERVSFINKKACSVLGVEAPVILGKSITDYVLMQQGILSEFSINGEEDLPREYNAKIITNNDRVKDYRVAIRNFENVQGKHSLVTFFPQAADSNNNVRVDSGNDFKEFVYIVSHDLKAPLRAILALVDWLQSDYLERFDEEGKELLNLIQSRTNRLGGMLEGLIQYSRLINNEELDVPIDLPQLIKGVLGKLNVPEGVEIEIEEAIPGIVGKRTKIEVLYEQLLKNSINFLGKENGKIKVGFDVSEKVYFVSDDGPGIDNDHKDRIFQIFQTLNPKDEVESTGVGLTLARKVAELHGGKMWLDTVNDTGTRMLFTFGLN
ncbi:MAG: ATP-binding protein [Cyclobacteriaceae bacterium]|nr:ATP-binding protein [Cyclobacteriaceae bacterium]